MRCGYTGSRMLQKTQRFSSGAYAALPGASSAFYMNMGGAARHPPSFDMLAASGIIGFHRKFPPSCRVDLTLLTISCLHA
ncbi:hypothetical protein ASZ90_009235 [hydrocarbon metagenome]|uniref:Uncharacterized protein n=1 Tax=hydrocarbon metagenome TaxID=938273 RepID=A0A0W8FJI9_9ZZZZ